jgi:hypothetical protein
MSQLSVGPWRESHAPMRTFGCVRRLIWTSRSNEHGVPMRHALFSTAALAGLMSVAAWQTLPVQAAGAPDIVVAQRGDRDGARGGGDRPPGKGPGPGAGPSDRSPPSIDGGRRGPGPSMARERRSNSSSIRAPLSDRSDGDRRLRRGDGPRSDGVIRRAPGPRYDSWRRSGRPWLGGRRFSWGPGISFYFWNGYYYGDCAWLLRRARATGQRYWWNRYRRCRNIY